jgi:hypothetical protein
MSELVPPMKLDDLAKRTADLDATAFVTRHPYPALVFLSTFTRPQGDQLDTLSGVTIADVRAAEAALAVKQESATACEQVGKTSLVLFLEARFDPAAGVTLGRSLEVDYTLPRASVSKSHATFRRESGSWLVTDLSSANGTFVDGERLPAGASAKLSDGSLVGFGPDTLAKFFRAPAFHGFLCLYRSGFLG